MTKVKYQPQKQLYDSYYTQSGRGNFPVFQGALIQKGYGLGGIIGGWFRSIIPLMKPMLSKGIQYALPIIKKKTTKLGKHVVVTGAKTLADVITKKNTLIKSSYCYC